MKKFLKYFIAILCMTLLINNVKAEEKTNCIGSSEFNCGMDDIDCIGGPDDTDCLSIISDEIDEKMMFQADDNVGLSKDVLGSAFLVGSNVKLDKRVNGISFLAGADSKFTGTTDYLFNASSTVNIDGTINNDVFIACSSAEFGHDSYVGRDANIAASNINLKGIFKRDVNLIGSEIVLDDVVIDGDLNVNAGNIVISENTIINGTLTYNSDANVKISSESSIKDIVVNEVTAETKKDTILYRVESIVFSIIRIVVLFAFMTLCIPKFIKILKERNQIINGNKVFVLFALGIAGLLCVPFVCLLLLISNVGLSIGLILLPIYIICIYMSTIFSGYMLGNIIEKNIIKKDINDLLIGIIGITLIYLLRLIPYIGGFISILSILFGIGIVADLIINKK